MKKTALILTLLLTALLLLPYIFADKIEKGVRAQIDESVEGDFSFGEVSLSFFKHFPNLTLTLDSVTLCSVPGFSPDTLITGKKIAFGVNLLSLLGKEIKINKIFASGLDIRYTVTDAATPLQQEENPSSAAIKLPRLSIKMINVKDSRVRFLYPSLQLGVELTNISFRGKGRIDDNIFRAKATLSSNELTVEYGGVKYIDSKEASISLVTEIDASKLTLSFKEGVVSLGRLNAKYDGVVNILDDGYSAHISMDTQKATLSHLLSLLPSEYDDWVAGMEINGNAWASVQLKGEARDSTGTQPNLNIRFNLERGFLKHKSSGSAISSIGAQGSLSIPSLNPHEMLFSVDSLRFKVDGEESALSLSVKGLDSPLTSIYANGSLNLEALKNAAGIDGYQLKGVLSYNVDAKGTLEPESGIFPVGSCNFELRDGFIKTPFSQEPLERINISARVSSNDSSKEGLNIEILPLEFNFAGTPFALECSLENFNNLKYSINATGILNLNRLYSMFNIDNARVNGLFSAQFSVKGVAGEVGVKALSNFEGRGRLELTNFEYQSEDYAYPLRVPSSHLTFEQDRAILDRMLIEYGRNKIVLNGYISDFIPYILSSGVMKGSMSVKSQSIDLKDFIALLPESDTLQTNEGVVIIPQKLNLSLLADVKKIEYESLTGYNFKGEAAISEQALYIKGTGVNIAGAHFLLDAVYKPLDKLRAEAEIYAKADSFDIARAYREIPLMRELFSTAANMEGVVSLNYSISTKLNSSMKPILPSVKGKGVIQLEDVNVKGFKVLGAVSKVTGRDSLNNPNLKAVEIRTSIANNIVTIERTRMRIFGFRPRFEGQTSLDGRLNINFRLGLSPFGIIGIPLKITGTLENPVVDIRRGREEDILDHQEEEER